MKKEDVIITGDRTVTKDRARWLVQRTLEQFEPAIDIVAVKVDPDNTPPLGGIGYRCTILLRITGGTTLQSEAHDCDEMLAVYRALNMMICKIGPAMNIADPRKAAGPTPTADPY